MQTVVETEYQDIYRVKDGALLIVNKFKPIDYSTQTDSFVRVYDDYRNCRQYNKNCQRHLKVLKKDVYVSLSDITIPKGTVLYQGRPVNSINNAEEFEYQIKTTSDSFSGNSSEMAFMLNDIMNIMGVIVG